MPSDNPNPGGQPGPVQAALLGLCPKCGERTLFGGLADFAPSCSACGLDFSRFNVGDGPAAFLTLVVGLGVVLLGVWLELGFHPPIWVHAVVLIPVTALAVLGGLRVTKAWLLQSEYWRKAKEATGADIGEKPE